MVLFQHCDTYDERIILAKMREIFDANGGADKFGGPGRNVVIKPNLVAKKKPEEAATTHPSFVWAIATILKETGANVTICESPGGLYDKPTLKALYKFTGIEDAATRAGAELNFDTSVTHVSNPDALDLKNLDILTPLAKADVVISLTKLKTHGMMVYTGAVKNLFGAIAGLGKAEYHCKMPDYDNFADVVTDIFLSVKPALSIIDGILGMHKDGPTAGEPINTNLIISSTNAFEADRMALDVICASPNRVPMARRAIARLLMPKDIDSIETFVGASDVADDSSSKITKVDPRKVISEFRHPEFVVKYNDDNQNLKFKDGLVGDVLTAILRPRPVFTKKCMLCGECAKDCPAKAITIPKRSKDKKVFARQHAEVDLKKCIRCYCCQELCPFKAVNIKKSFISKMISGKAGTSSKQK